jgi:hypothetical protein
MEYYKVNSYDSDMSNPTEIKTNAPKDIVEDISDLFDHIDKEKWSVCPIMIDPNNLSVIFTLIERYNNKLHDIYRVTISKDKKKE